MRVEVCEHCRERDDRDNMVTPCQCYKKFEDRGWWHLECLKDHLAQLDVQGTTRCPHCAKPYRIKFSFEASCDRVCSCSSLNHLFELCIIVFTLLCTVVAFSIVDWSKELDDAPFLRVLVGGLGVVTLVLVVLTVRKVYMRWKTATSKPVLADSV